MNKEEKLLMLIQDEALTSREISDLIGIPQYQVSATLKNLELEEKAIAIYNKQTNRIMYAGNKFRSLFPKEKRPKGREAVE